MKKNNYRIGVSGPRNASEKTLCELRLVLTDRYLLYPDAVLIHGGAIGVDQEALRFTNEVIGSRTRPIKPDYKKFNPKLAPIIRNVEIANTVDELHVFWHGKPYGGSISTAWMYNKLGKIKESLFLWPIDDSSKEDMMAVFQDLVDNPPEHWELCYKLWKDQITS